MPNAMTETPRSEAASVAADILDGYLGGKPATVTADNGVTYVVSIEHDSDNNLPDSGDWYGQLETAIERYSKGQRPSGFNGNAEVVFSDRHGRVWWQPPADVPRNSNSFAAMRKRVRGWYNDDWTYVGVVVEAHYPQPCGHTDTVTESLWGIESDAGDYFAEVIGELMDQCDATR